MTAEQILMAEFKKLVEKFAKPNEEVVVFDIGARDLKEAEIFSNSWPKVRVHSFEPNPNQSWYCAERAKTFPDKITFNPVGLSNYIGESDFFKCLDNVGQSSIFDYSEKFKELKTIPSCERCKIKVTTIDDYCSQNGVKRINGIWMDTQASELQILEGGKNALKFTDVVYCETWFLRLYESNSLYEDVHAFLTENNFIQFWTDTPKGRTLVTDWRGPYIGCNVIFVNKSLL